MIRRDRSFLKRINEEGPWAGLIAGAFKEHAAQLPRLNMLDDYYKGRHDILRRADEGAGRPNVKIVYPFPQYIVTMSTGYLLGDKIQYSNDKPEDIRILTNSLNRCAFWSTDEEVARLAAIFGRSFELIYVSRDRGETLPASMGIDPRQAFIVYGDDAKKESLFGVYYFKTDDGYMVQVYTANRIYAYEVQDLYKESEYLSPVHVNPHYLSGIPLIEYMNNGDGTGDFENVITLIDAYNQLQSDRMNDVERFVRAILFLKNFTLDEADAAALKNKRVLQAAGSETDAKWLVNSLDQNGVEILRKTIEDDISKFSLVPNLGDEQFLGNISGVAMKYKLIGLNQMTKIKKRYMEQSLRKRLRLVLPVFSAARYLNEADITVEFTHSLPVNDLETAQMVQTLEGIVSRETLLGQLSFVTDPAGEIEVSIRENETLMAKAQIPES